jgi:hypothetical protein
MATPPFDTAKAVSFDLARGLIALGGGAASVLVPVDPLDELCRAAGPEATSAFGRALGEGLGSQVRRRLEAIGSDARKATIEVLLDQLAGEWATLGLGALTVERWGRALVFVADHAALRTSGDALLASVLSAALASASGNDCRCVPLAREGQRVRLLVTSAAGASRAASWVAQGISWGEVLVRLHADTGTGSTS